MSINPEDYPDGPHLTEIRARWAALSREEQQQRWLAFLAFLEDLNDDDLILTFMGDEEINLELKAADINWPARLPLLHAKITELLVGRRAALTQQDPP